MTYSGEWLGDRFHGGGVFTWRDGSAYAGNWRDGGMFGRGTWWLPDGRCFHGTWDQDRPLRGTALETNGKLHYIICGEMTWGDLWRWDWAKSAERKPCGQVIKGGKPPPPLRVASHNTAGVLLQEWTATVELVGGNVYEGPVRGLCPCGAGIQVSVQTPPIISQLMFS